WSWLRLGAVGWGRKVGGFLGRFGRVSRFVTFVTPAPKEDGPVVSLNGSPAAAGAPAEPVHAFGGAGRGQHRHAAAEFISHRLVLAEPTAFPPRRPVPAAAPGRAAGPAGAARGARVPGPQPQPAPRLAGPPGRPGPSPAPPARRPAAPSRSCPARGPARPRGAAAPCRRRSAARPSVGRTR